MKIMDVVHRLGGEYLMPAIQREFVWSTDQICLLFDSIYKEFPLGALLLWEVRPPNVQNYGFYDFVTDFHELNKPFADEVSPDPAHSLVAILDGQQRLSALNIGLRGSYTARRKHGRRLNPDHYTKLRLCLNMKWEVPASGEAAVEPEELFVFKSKDDLLATAEEPNYFYPVSEIYQWGDTPDFGLAEALQGPGYWLLEHEAHRAAGMAHKLHHRLRDPEGLLTSSIDFEDADFILQAFVRLNSEGTTLSKADFILAMATNQWVEKNARQEVRQLVEDLNNIGRGFAFEKAMVLKAGLAMVGAPIGFNLKNFTIDTSQRIERHWEDIKAHLVTAAKLLHAFGFDERSLPVKDAVMLPLAMYLNHNDIGEQVVTLAQHQDKRDAMKKYVLIACLIQDYWGRGVDTNLSNIRTAIENDDGSDFPLEKIRSNLSEAGAPMEFGDDALDEVMDLEYGKRYTFPALAILIGEHLDFREVTFHVDHIFPKNLTTATKLRSQGVDEKTIVRIQELRDGLSNLQLLAGVRNIEKQDMLPSAWLGEMTKAQRGNYVAAHQLGRVPKTMKGFETWYQTRRKVLRNLLEEKLA